MIMTDMDNTYEPKKINFFRVEFPEKFGIDDFMVRHVDRPKWNNGKWETIEIELIDYIGPSTSQKVFHNIINRYDDDLKFEFNIVALDPLNIPVEKWNIVADKFRIDFGEFKTKVVDSCTIKIFVEPLSCVLKY
jgi:hypothetical protein